MKLQTSFKYILKIISLFIISTYSFKVGADYTEKKCRKSFQSLFSDKVINIDIFIGYLDMESNNKKTLDKQLESRIEKLITSSCINSPYNQLCDFIQIDNDNNENKKTFLKDYISLNNKEHQLKIRLFSSSHTNKNLDNYGENYKKQLKKTKGVEDAFIKSLQNSHEMIFYIGHRRFGAAPSFRKESALSLLKGNHGEKLIEKGLEMNNKDPKIFGMASCESYEYFASKLNKLMPGTALLLTHQQVTFLDSMNIVLTSIDSLLDMSCSKKFHNELNTSIKYLYLHEPLVSNNSIDNVKYPKLYGFFEEHKEYNQPRRVEALMKRSIFEKIKIKNPLYKN